MMQECGVVIKMNMKLNYLILAMFLISFASAGLGTFQQDTCVNVRTILNSTQVNISSISYPNNTVVYLDEAMTSNGNSFNYSFCDTNPLGKYIYDYFDLEGNVYVNDFEISYNGDNLTPAKAGMFAIMLGSSVLFWFLVLFYITKLPSKNTMNEESMMQVSQLKYLRDALYGVLWFLTMGILFLASNIGIAYLPGQMIGNFLFAMFSLMMWTTIPMGIVLIIWIFYQLMTDKETKRYIERGFDFGGDI